MIEIWKGEANEYCHPQSRAQMGVTTRGEKTKKQEQWLNEDKHWQTVREEVCTRTRKHLPFRDSSMASQNFPGKTSLVDEGKTTSAHPDGRIELRRVNEFIGKGTSDCSFLARGRCASCRCTNQVAFVNSGIRSRDALNWNELLEGLQRSHVEVWHVHGFIPRVRSVHRSSLVRNRRLESKWMPFTDVLPAHQWATDGDREEQRSERSPVTWTRSTRESVSFSGRQHLNHSSILRRLGQKVQRVFFDSMRWSETSIWTFIERERERRDQRG